jgi:hypothetical protein
MPWKASKIPTKMTQGNYFWVAKKDYVLTTRNDESHKAEVHVTVTGKDISKPAGTFKEFHVKFDVKTSSVLRIFFFFTDSGGRASLSTSKGTNASAALKMGISGGEYAELKAEAIRVATSFAATVSA